MSTTRNLTGMLLAITVVCTFSILNTPAWGVERDELGKVLQTIPPNGPPEHYGNVILRKKSK
jgi:hypothetical protein